MKAKSRTASEALDVELRALCLQEYPFGTGSWQVSPKQPLASRMYATTTIDYGSEKDHIETLSQLITSSKSPWFSEAEWSEELPLLRKIAITEPQKLTPEFMQKTFRTLRLINRNVSTIDEKLLELRNLEELSLSANYLSTINSEFLPPKLKVLELNANSIADIESLIKNPPPLQHLGLAKNLLENLSNHISITYWPNLMSLDLSDNNLKDLLILVENLKSLPKLRTLLLCGNPVSLMPSYRGYTIDSLGNLTSLDDVIITADERHDFKGMNKRSELLKNEARITVKIPFVRGIPNPAELDEAEKNGGEYPVIERKYHVRFPFISNVEKRLIKSADLVQEAQEKDAANKKAPKGKAKSPVQKTPEELEAERLEQERLAEIERIRIAGPPNIVPFSTATVEFDADQLSLDHEEQFRVTALIQLKRLFTSGLKFEVMEEKTLFYPVGQNPDELAVERTNSGGKDRGATPMKPAQLAAAKMGGGGGGGGAGGAKKSFGHPGSVWDLVKYSSTMTCVGSAVLDVSSLLSSSDQSKVRTVLHAGGGPMRQEDLDILMDTPPATAASDMKKDKKDKKKTTKPSGKDNKKKGGPIGGGPGSGEDEVEALPAPIIILAELDLRRWTKTKHFVKEHDEWS